MLRRLVVTAALGSALTVAAAVGGASAARAADRDCGDFPNQRAAQDYFISRGGPSQDPDRLDADGDGIACESNRAPYDRIAVPRDFDPRAWVVPGQDLYDCGDFLSQAEAQAVLRVDPSDPNRLDGNRNGVACEDYTRPPYSLYPVAR